MKRLIHGNADAGSLQPSGTLPLHEAAAAGHRDVVAFFFETGTSPDAMDSDGQTSKLHKCVSESFSGEVC